MRVRSCWCDICETNPCTTQTLDIHTKLGSKGAAIIAIKSGDNCFKMGVGGDNGLLSKKVTTNINNCYQNAGD